MEILQSHVSGSQNADEQVYHALMESMGNPSEDRPPPRPEGVHGNEPDQPTYSKMMAALVDQVKKEVDKSESENRRDEYTRHLRGHLGKIKDLQNQLENKLAELEREESRKITSDSIHTGFDSSFVNKADKKKPASKMESKKIETVEVLNPGVIKTGSSATAESGEQPSSSPQPKSKDGGDQDAAGDADDDSDIGPSELGKEFAKIKIGEYQRCLEFISKNPEIVNQRETDGLLAEAFEAQLDGKDEYARQCVHHALLLQYCRSLGKDGVGIFFKRSIQARTLTSFILALLTDRATEYSPEAIRVSKCFMTMSVQPMPGSVIDAKKSKSNAPPMGLIRTSNKSSFIRLSQEQRSISSFHNQTVRTKSKDRPVPSSRPFHQNYRNRWKVEALKK